MLEGEQIHCLLVQLVHSFLTVFGDWEKNRCDGALYRHCGVHSKHQQGEDDRNGIGSDHWNRCELRSNGLAQLALDPRRANYRAGFAFERVREVHNRAARLRNLFPISTRGISVGREKGEINFIELLVADALNESHFIFNGFELAGRLVVIEQFDLRGGKIALLQNFRDVLTLQRSRPHNRHPIKTGYGFEVRNAG